MRDRKPNGQHWNRFSMTEITSSRYLCPTDMKITSRIFDVSSIDTTSEWCIRPTNQPTTFLVRYRIQPQPWRVATASGRGIEVIEVPGHTPGICALYLSEQDLLLATDVLNRSDRRGLPTGFLLPPPAAYNWNTEQAEENLQKLLQFDLTMSLSRIEQTALLKMREGTGLDRKSWWDEAEDG